MNDDEEARLARKRRGFGCGCHPLERTSVDARWNALEQPSRNLRRVSEPSAFVPDETVLPRSGRPQRTATRRAVRVDAGVSTQGRAPGAGGRRGELPLGIRERGSRSAGCERPEGQHGYGLGDSSGLYLSCVYDLVLEHPALEAEGFEYLVSYFCRPPVEDVRGYAIIMHGQLTGADGCWDWDDVTTGAAAGSGIPRFYGRLQHGLAARGIASHRILTSAAGSAGVFTAVARMLVDEGASPDSILLVGSSQAGAQAIRAAVLLADSPVGLVVCWAPAAVDRTRLPSSTQFAVLCGTHDDDVLLHGSYATYNQVSSDSLRVFMPLRGLAHADLNPSSGLASSGPYTNNTRFRDLETAGVGTRATLALVDNWLDPDGSWLSEMLFDGVGLARPSTDLGKVLLPPNFRFPLTPCMIS